MVIKIWKIKFGISEGILNSRNVTEIMDNIELYISRNFEHQYLIALSYPNAKIEADYFKKLADALGEKYHKSRILYDGFWRKEFEQHNADQVIRDLYKNKALICVWCVSNPSDGKVTHEWWEIESQAIYDISREDEGRLLYLSFGDEQCKIFQKIQEDKAPRRDMFINQKEEEAIYYVTERISEIVERYRKK